MKREERDLSRLPTSCLTKQPTKFLVETYRFSKPVSFNVYCACLARALLVCMLTIIEPTVDYGFHEFREFEIRAIKPSVAMLGDKRIKEITTLQRKVILGFLKGRDTFACLPTGYGKSLIFASS